MCMCKYFMYTTIIVTVGGHFGRDKTVEKIFSRFYWKNMYEIRDFVQQCTKCQQMNARFLKSNATPTPRHTKGK